jgi:hypothetical protein
MSPLIVLPVLLIRLAMTTAMYAGGLTGGCKLDAPGDVVHVPPQVGGGTERVLAKP